VDRQEQHIGVGNGAEQDASGACGHRWVPAQIRRHAPRTIALDDAVDGHIPDSKLCNIHLDSPFISFGWIQRFVSPLQRALIGTHQVRGLARDQMRLDVE
jgi:hypothetical protein